MTCADRDRQTITVSQDEHPKACWVNNIENSKLWHEGKHAKHGVRVLCPGAHTQGRKAHALGFLVVS